MSNKLNTTLLLAALATHLGGCAPRQAYYNPQQAPAHDGQSHYQVERDLNFALQAQPRILDKSMPRKLKVSGILPKLSLLNNKPLRKSLKFKRIMCWKRGFL